MSKNQGPFVIPSSQSDRDAIASAVKEAGDSKIRIQAENDLIKDIGAVLKDDHNLDGKTFNKMVRVYVKSEFAKVTGEAEDFAETYSEIMGKVDPMLRSTP